MSLATNLVTELDTRSNHRQKRLTHEQIDALQQRLGSRYVLDLHNSYEEGLAVMITDSQARDADIVLYVDVEPVGLCLSLLKQDTLHHQGCYTGLGGLVLAIHALSRQNGL